MKRKKNDFFGISGGFYQIVKAYLADEVCAEHEEIVRPSVALSYVSDTRQSAIQLRNEHFGQSIALQ